MKNSDFMFSDEKDFLSLREEGKLEFSETYSARSGYILDSLEVIWGLQIANMKGEYITDYKALNSTLHDFRTSWIDHYSTTLYSCDAQSEVTRHESQPILRWFKTLCTIGRERTTQWSMG